MVDLSHFFILVCRSQSENGSCVKCDSCVRSALYQESCRATAGSPAVSKIRGKLGVFDLNANTFAVIPEPRVAQLRFYNATLTVFVEIIWVVTQGVLISTKTVS